MRDSCSPPVRSSNLRGKQNRHPTEYRNFVEFLPRPCRWGLSDLVHWLRPKPAELAPFLSGANNSAIGASDPAAVAACGCARRLRHVPGGIVSNSSGAPAATSSDSHARLRRRPNRCEFFPGGTHCGGGAGIPPDYRRFVAVGKWMV